MRSRAAQTVRAAVSAMVLAVALVAAVPVTAHAENGFTEGMVKTFDALVLRPLGFVTTLVGFGLFIPAVVITAPSGSDGIEQTWDIFVVSPVEHTFTRPLGEF